METTKAVQIDPPATERDLSTASPTVTRYMDLANEFMIAFDALAAKVPKYEYKDPAAVGFVTAHIGVPLKCLNTAVAAVEQAKELQGIDRIGLDEAHDTLQFIDAFAKVLDKVDTFAEALRWTINSRRASLAFGALQVYGVTKMLARGSAAIAGHAMNIGRDLGRKGKKLLKQKQQPGTPPSGGAPAPSSPTTAPHEVTQ